MRKTPLFLSMLLVVLLLALPVQADVLPIADRTFGTPDAALKHFYGGLFAHDLDTMFEATHLKYAERYDYKAALAFTGMISPQFPQGAPTEYPLYADLAEIEFAAHLTFQIKNLAYSLILDEPYNDQFDNYGVMRRIEDDFSIDEYIAALDPGTLENVTITKIVEAEHDDMNEEQWERYKEDRYGIYGADDYDERIIYLKRGDKEFAASASLLAYDGDWRILSLNSFLAGAHNAGYAVPADAFDPSPMP